MTTGDGSGGGLDNDRGTATLTNCTVSGNSASTAGSGGGVFSWYATTTLTNCTVSGNSAASRGAAWTTARHGHADQLHCQR